MNEKPNIEVTILSKEEVENPSKTLQKIGIGSNRSYWTNTSSVIFGVSTVYELFVSSSGEPRFWSYVDDNNGIRPILKSDNLEELIKNCKSEIKDDIQIIEYGHFPHLFEKMDINEECLKKTDKKYILPSQKNVQDKFYMTSYQEYDYYGQKLIQGNHEYYPIKPVKFAVDKENSRLISLGVLFDSPINVENKNYNGNFETSELYQYLNNEFIKSLLMDVNIAENESPVVDLKEDENYLQTITSENNSLKDEIQKKKELLERLKELVKENETLRLQSRNIDSEIKKIISGMRNKCLTKKFTI